MTFRFRYRGENQYNEITPTTEWIYLINILSSHSSNLKLNYLNKITDAWVKSRLRKNDNIQYGDPLIGNELLLQVNQTLKMRLMAIFILDFSSSGDSACCCKLRPHDWGEDAGGEKVSHLFQNLMGSFQSLLFSKAYWFNWKTIRIIFSLLGAYPYLFRPTVSLQVWYLLKEKLPF